MSDYTKDSNFWQRLKTFVKDVDVSDPCSEDEKDMILNVCEEQVAKIDTVGFGPYVNKPVKVFYNSGDAIKDKQIMEILLIKFHGHTEEQFREELLHEYPFSELPGLVRITWNMAKNQSNELPKLP